MPLKEHVGQDWIAIHDLKIKTQIGIHKWEKQIQQTLVFDIAMQVDLSQPITQLSESIDYTSISQAVISLMRENAFELIETVAQQVAALLLKSFKLSQVNITVKKPHAIDGASGVSVSLVRVQGASG